MSQRIGCCLEETKTPLCDTLCPIHNCVREKGPDTCADCMQSDGYPTLRSITANSPSVFGNPNCLRESRRNKTN